MRIEFDDSGLRKALNELEPKRQMQAVKGGFRKIGSMIRRKAVGNLRTAVRSNRELEKGVRMRLYRDNSGAYVTIGEKRMVRRNKGRRNGRRRYGHSRMAYTGMSMHTNSRGETKPVLVWLEAGTKSRRTKTATGAWVRKRRGHSTGRVDARLFMEKTHTEMRGLVIADVDKAVTENVRRVIRKYGK